jgi:hypothetical protein
MDIVDTVSNNPYYDTAISDVQPTLNLDFVNSKTLDPRITFARASTATYYDAKSSAVAEQNLALQSQTFDNASWTKSGSVTVTADSIAAPDGTTTADTLTAGSNAAGYLSQVLVSTAGTTYTYSIYAQAGNISTMDFGGVNQGVTTFYARFTLSGAGSVSILTGSPTATITQVGSSAWYRCTVTKTFTNGNVNDLFQIFPGNNGAITNGNYIYIWGAQLEQRSSATAYNATTTTALTNYIPTLQTAAANVARLDYDPVTRVPNGLLIEESRTNLLIDSASFNSWGTGGNGGVYANTNIAPDGSLSADTLYAATTGTDASVFKFYTFSATAYTLSVYAKAGSKSVLAIASIDAVPAFPTGYFNLATGATAVTGTATAAITSVGNGWYRCSITFTAGAATSPVKFFVCDASGSNTATANTYGGIYLWGAQLEAGAFPTSYIPTTTVAVARSADAASMTGTNFSSWFNNAQGTMYSETTTGINSSAKLFYRIGISGVSSGSIGPYAFSSSILLDKSGTGTLFTQTGYSGSAKYALSYTPTGVSALFNGGTTSTSTSTVAPNCSVLSFGNENASNGNMLNGYIRKLQYFPQALSNAELQEMTA